MGKALIFIKEIVGVKSLALIIAGDGQFCGSAPLPYIRLNEKGHLGCGKGCNRGALVNEKAVRLGKLEHRLTQNGDG